jgi:hypothetical protein
MDDSHVHSVWRFIEHNQWEWIEFDRVELWFQLDLKPAAALRDIGPG